MIARFLDDLEDTAKNPTWRPAELQAIDAPPALDYRTPDHTANAAKYMDLYGAKRRAEAKYAEAGPEEGRVGPQSGDIRLVPSALVHIHALQSKKSALWYRKW